MAGLLFGLLIPAAALFGAEPSAVHVETSDRQAHLTLEWTSSFTYESSVRGRELLLRFSKPIEIAHADQLVNQAQPWLTNIETGFDTLLIETARDVVWAVQTEGNNLIITVGFVASAATPDPAVSTRLDLIRAQALFDSGHEKDALALLRQLVASHPDNARVLTTLASMESAANRQRFAAELYSRAGALDPLNEDITDSAAELDGTRGSRVETDFDSKQVAGAQTEALTTSGVRSRLSPGLDAGLRFVSDVFTAPGGVSGVRTRGEASLTYEFENGALARGSIYESAGQAGGGLQFTVPDAKGQTGVTLAYRQPDWDFLQTLSGNGVRDRAGFWREQKLSPRTTGRIETGVNRYGLAGIAAARSFYFEGSVSYRILDHPNLVAEYGMDKEDRYSLGWLTEGDGQIVAPLPLVSREVHSATLNSSRTVWRHWQVEAYGGGAVDRLGGHTPFFGGRLISDPKGRLHAEIFFDRRLYILNKALAETWAGGRLSWRF